MSNSHAQAAPGASSIDGLSKAVMALAIVWTAVQAVVLGVAAFASSTPASVTAGAVFAVVQVATFVVACRWLQLSREAVLTANPAAPRTRSPVWVWMGWVIPVIAFWVPYQVVRDVRAGAVSSPRPGLGAWWGFWVASWLLANVVQLPSWAGGDGASGSVQDVVVGGLALVATVVALVLWVRVVQDVTDGQRRLRGAVAPTS